MRNFKPLLSFCGCADRFVSYLVANPEDRFSRDEAQISNYIYRPTCKVSQTVHDQFDVSIQFGAQFPVFWSIQSSVMVDSDFLSLTDTNLFPWLIRTYRTFFEFLDWIESYRYGSLVNIDVCIYDHTLIMIHYDQHALAPQFLGNCLMKLT